MHKIPSDALIHSEDALIHVKETDTLLLKLIDVPESSNESDSVMFSAVCTPLTPIINELDTVMVIHENNKTRHTGE